VAVAAIDGRGKLDIVVVGFLVGEGGLLLLLLLLLPSSDDEESIAFVVL